jgi:AraC-like DNA-binding protein
MTARLTPQELDQYVEQVRTWFQTADLRYVTIDDAAAAACLHPTSVQYRLRLAGVSWLQLRAEERLRRVGPLLKKPGRFDAGAAAAWCGFSGPPSFYRFFQDMTGESFTQWRMRLQTCATNTLGTL